MTQERLGRLKRAAERVTRLDSPFPIAPAFFGGPAGEDEIAELLEPEPYPPDYVSFLRSCRRFVAMDFFNGYALLSPAQLGGGADRIVVDDGAGPREVRVVRIGHDGGGNGFLMGLAPHPSRPPDGDFGRVWKHSHEYPASLGGVAQMGLTLVADSFSGFLARVAEDWEHFADDDRSWSYVSG